MNFIFRILKALPLLPLVLVLSSIKALAVVYEFPGVGARAAARGGAVTADAGDWTAIYWNPAGLSGAERQIGFGAGGGYGYAHDPGSARIYVPLFKVVSPFDKKNQNSLLGWGAIGAAVPLSLGGTLGVGVYTPRLRAEEFSDTSSAGPVSMLRYKSAAYTSAVNVSYAADIKEGLSAGCGLNFLVGHLISELHLSLLGMPYDQDMADYVGSGLEGVAGMAWSDGDRWQTGFVLRSGAKMVYKGEQKQYLAGRLVGESNTAHSLRHPATSALGAAWKARPDLKFSLDISQTWWKGSAGRTYFGNPASAFRNIDDRYPWQNAFKTALGVQKKIGEKTELAAGYSFETPSMDSHSVDLTTALDTPMHRLSGGYTRRAGATEFTIGAMAGDGVRSIDGKDYSYMVWSALGEIRYFF